MTRTSPLTAKITTSLLGQFRQKFVDDEGVGAVLPAQVVPQSDVFQRVESTSEVALPVLGSGGVRLTQFAFKASRTAQRPY